MSSLYRHYSDFNAQKFNTNWDSIPQFTVIYKEVLKSSLNKFRRSHESITNNQEDVDALKRLLVVAASAGSSYTIMIISHNLKINPDNLHAISKLDD